jgi:hypothetical protein
MNYQTEQAIERLLVEIESAEEEAQNWQAQVDKSKAELMALMEKHELSTIAIQVREEDQRVTVVRPTQLKIDEQGLQDAVSEAIWRTITKRVIDKKALEDAVTRGKVEAETVSKHSKEVATKPYLRITR